jgi:hypothetical protein
MVTDSYSVLVRWGNHFSQLLNVHGVIDFRHIKIHAAEPLMPELSDFEFKMAIEKPERHNQQVLIKSQQK